MIKELFEQFVGTAGECYVMSRTKLGNTIYSITDSYSDITCEITLNTSFPYEYDSILQLIHDNLLKIIEISFY